MNNVIKKFLYHLFLLLLTLAFMFPIVSAISVSFREPGYGLTSEIFPDELYFGNYERLLGSPRFARSLQNSAIYSVGGAVLTTIVSTFAAYAFARMNFKGKDAILFYLLVMLMLPGLTNIIPLYKIASDFRMLNTYSLMIIIFGAYGVPIGIWVMKSFFESIPKEIEESAAIDGASTIQTLLRVVAPICAPGLIAAFLLNFLYNWNNFFLPLVLTTKSDMKMATVALFDFQRQMEGSRYELQAAACVIIMVPTILLFLFTRKMFMRGMIEGAIKG